MQTGLDKTPCIHHMRAVHDPWPQIQMGSAFGKIEADERLPGPCVSNATLHGGKR
jgi:hypothetical protein